MNTRAKFDMNEEDWTKLTAGFTMLKDQPIEVDDGTGYTVSYLKNSIRTHHQKHGKVFDGLFYSLSPAFAAISQM